VSSGLRPLTEGELEDPSFGQNGFGCSPRNGKGLGLKFVAHGNEARTRVVLDRSYESYPGMIHGGIVAVILDEVTARAALWHARAFVVTIGFRMRFGAVMRPGIPYVARANVESVKGDHLTAFGVLETESAVLVATCTTTLLTLRGERLDEFTAELPEETRALVRDVNALGESVRP
jgi:acyl-coenzyme A thioesterase PaaI-like protein